MVCRIVAVERDESTDESTDEVFGKRLEDYVAKRNPGPGLANFTRPSWGLLINPIGPDACEAWYSRPSWLVIPRPTWVDPEEE